MQLELEEEGKERARESWGVGKTEQFAELHSHDEEEDGFSIWRSTWCTFSIVPFPVDQKRFFG